MQERVAKGVRRGIELMDGCKNGRSVLFGGVCNNNKREMLCFASKGFFASRDGGSRRGSGRVGFRALHRG
jgi:hypothetical protein